MSEERATLEQKQASRIEVKSCFLGVWGLINCSMRSYTKNLTWCFCF